MRHLFTFFGFLLLTGCAQTPAENPDPNHTHADFSVWIGGEMIDFSGEQYMSGSSDEALHVNANHEHLHLHDGNGQVMHRHKPNLSIGEFFSSLPGIRYYGTEFKFLECMQCQHAQGSYPVRLFVNGTEEPMGATYQFNDLDQLLITDTQDPAELRLELRSMTSDACLYSRTCPERGDPPTENCVADPEVPCTL